MPLKDFAEFLEPLTPVYKGKGYPLPPVGVRDAIPLMQTLDSDDEFFLTEDEFERILLGPALEQMREDNVPPVFIRHAFTCAIIDFTSGREAAEERYGLGVDLPKAETPPSSPEESGRSTGTGEEIATPSPASTTGTTTSPKTSPRKPKPATRSGGTRSSTSGRSSKPASTPSSGSTS